MNELQYQIYSFQIISILMLIFFIYQWSNNPLYKSLLLWSTLVLATPLPNASILISFPAKIFFNIPLYISQIIASLLSILFILYIPSLSQPHLLKQIMKHRAYMVVLISIISSILISNIIDDIMNGIFNTIKFVIALILIIIYFITIRFYV